MRRLSLLIAITGILVLFILMHYSPPKQINSFNELTPLKENTKIIFSGIVKEDKEMTSSRLITLDNNISFYCECIKLKSLKNNEVEVLGVIDFYSYNNISILKIELN